MALFAEQAAQLAELKGRWRAEGRARSLIPRAGEPWPRGSSLVLEEDTACELGNPSLASVSMLLSSDAVEDGAITLVGPDIAEREERRLPFGQVVMVSGSFADQYESFRELRDAVYDTRLRGLSVRTLPSRQSIWCRVSRQAADDGLTFADLGAALIEGLKRLPGVEGAEVLFVTASPEDVRALAPAAAGVQRVVDAMMKMYEEDNFDCDTCEYREVCDTVMDLKQIRKKLEEQKAAER